MPTTVQLKSDAPQEINISTSAGISITNNSAGAIQYFVDYKSNTGNWTGWKNGNRSLRKHGAMSGIIFTILPIMAGTGRRSGTTIRHRYHI